METTIIVSSFNVIKKRMISRIVCTFKGHLFDQGDPCRRCGFQIHEFNSELEYRVYELELTVGHIYKKLDEQKLQIEHDRDARLRDKFGILMP